MQYSYPGKLLPHFSSGGSTETFSVSKTRSATSMKPTACPPFAIELIDLAVVQEYDLVE
jgi:hypothetical protein